MVDGFLEVEVTPFPKSHCQEVGLPVERSEKFTIRGEQPFCGVAEKLATGACAKLFKKKNRLKIKRNPGLKEKQLKGSPGNSFISLFRWFYRDIPVKLGLFYERFYTEYRYYSQNDRCLWIILPAENRPKFLLLKVYLLPLPSEK